DVNDYKIEYARTTRKTNKISLKNFMSQWSGMVMAMETTNASGETNYKIKKQTEIKQTAIPIIYLALGLFTTIICVSINYTKIDNTTVRLYSLLPILKYFGMCISISLLSLQFNGSNHLFHRLCSFTPQSRCQVVLRSKGGSIFTGLSLSELGFFYFTGG